MSEKFWDKRSASYDTQVSVYEDSYARTIERIKEHVSTDDRVLDFACGTGNVSIKIARDVKEIHAIDISKGMLSIAEKKAKEQGLKNIKFTHTELLNAPFAKESFDVVLAINILHLLRNDNRCIQEIHKLLRPGGIFISATACLKQKRTLSNFLVLPFSKLGILPYISVLDKEKLDALISDNNFQIVHTEKLHDNPPNYLIHAKKVIGDW